MAAACHRNTYDKTFHSLLFILTVLKAYLFRKVGGKTVRDTAEEYGIAVSTLYE
jgi:hypothetical protein